MPKSDARSRTATDGRGRLTLAYLGASIFFVGLSLSSPVSADPSDREAVEWLFPEEIKKLDELDQKLKGWIDRVSGKPPPTADGPEVYVPPDWMKEALENPAPIMKSREEILALERADMRRAKQTRDWTINGIRDGLRSYVSRKLDDCKTAIAAGDEPSARSACADAELAIARCRSDIEPALVKRSGALTAKFVPYFGSEGNFTQYDVLASCDVMLKGLDDPRRLLAQADLRLPETSCHQHIDRLRRKALGEPIPNNMGQDDATVEGYRLFIARRCGPAFEQEAWRVISAAAHMTEQQRQLQRAALPRRTGGDGTALLSKSVSDVSASSKSLASVEEEVQRKKQAAIQQAGLAGAQAGRAMGTYVADTTNQAIQAQAQAAEAQADARAKAAAAAQAAAQQRQTSGSSPQQAGGPGPYPHSGSGPRYTETPAGANNCASKVPGGIRNNCMDKGIVVVTRYQPRTNQAAMFSSYYLPPGKIEPLPESTQLLISCNHSMNGRGAFVNGTSYGCK